MCTKCSQYHIKLVFVYGYKLCKFNANKLYVMLYYIANQHISIVSITLTLSLIYTLSDATAADGFFENIVTKEEVAQNEQFLLLPQCFPLLVKGYPFNYRDFLFLTKYVKSRLLQKCRMWERVNSLKQGLSL